MKSQKYNYENITYENIVKNVIYNNNHKTHFFHTSSHFFRVLTLAFIPDPLLHLTCLHHVKRPTSLHYFFLKLIRTDTTFDF